MNFLCTLWMHLEFCPGRKQTDEVNTQTLAPHVVSEGSSDTTWLDWDSLCTVVGWAGKAFEEETAAKYAAGAFSSAPWILARTSWLWLPWPHWLCFALLPQLGATHHGLHWGEQLTPVCLGSFPSFKIKSPMSWEPPSPSKLAQLVTLTVTQLRPRLGMSFACVPGADWPHISDRSGNSRATGSWEFLWNSHLVLAHRTNICTKHD